MTSVHTTIAQADDLPGALSDLTEILHRSVHAGASVGFILPFERETAEHFWFHAVFPNVRDEKSVLFLAIENDRVLGTVQLGLGMPQNQPHRADVMKLLVHPEARRRGVARQLMDTLETHARALGKTLLVLDTRSGDYAQPLYAAQGFDVAGEIPGYCKNPSTGQLEATTYMYKALA